MIRIAILQAAFVGREVVVLAAFPQTSARRTGAERELQRRDFAARRDGRRARPIAAHPLFPPSAMVLWSARRG
jgi:hypothetical protein